MRILVAPDRLDDRTGSGEVAGAVVRGWLAGAPHDDVTSLALGDGGPGLVAGLHAALGGELAPVTVTGPLGDPTPAVVLVTPDGDVVVEAAQACGAHLVPGPVDRRLTTSRGVGELVAAALRAGGRRVVVGTGGCVAHDGGAGLLAALGVVPDECAHGAAAFAGGLGPGSAVVTPRPLGDVPVVVAVDTDAPLLGLHGVSAALSPPARGHGALGIPRTADLGQELERVLGGFVHDLERAGVTGARGLAVAPGAGAGGGVAFALAVLGAALVPGAEVVAEVAGLAEAVAAADLVVTAEGSLDPHSLHDSVVRVVAEHGLARGVPVVAVPREAAVGRREWSAAGLAGVYPVAETPDELDAALADPLGTLERRVARVARTWSR